MATFASDSFTGPAGTSLLAHAPEVGVSWAKHPFYGASSSVLSDANRLRQSSSSQTAYYVTGGAPASADYDVAGDLLYLSAIGWMGLAGRMTTTAGASGDNHYGVLLDADLGQFRLYKRVASVETSLGTFTPAGGFAAGTAYHVVLSMRGTSIVVYVDGLPRITVTDSSLAAAGTCGLRLKSAMTNTTGVHLDNYAASDPVSTVQKTASDTGTLAAETAVGGSGGPSRTLKTASDSFTLTDVAVAMTTAAFFVDADGKGGAVGDDSLIRWPLAGRQGNPLQPFKTIQAAISALWNLGGGDTIIVRASSAPYPRINLSNILPQQPLTIVGYQSERPVVNGWTFSGASGRLTLQQLTAIQFMNFAGHHFVHKDIRGRMGDHTNPGLGAGNFVLDGVSDCVWDGCDISWSDYKGTDRSLVGPYDGLTGTTVGMNFRGSGQSDRNQILRTKIDGMPGDLINGPDGPCADWQIIGNELSRCNKITFTRPDGTIKTDHADAFQWDGDSDRAIIAQNLFYEMSCRLIIMARQDGNGFADVSTAANAASAHRDMTVQENQWANLSDFAFNIYNAPRLKMLANSVSNAPVNNRCKIAFTQSTATGQPAKPVSTGTVDVVFEGNQLPGMWVIDGAQPVNFKTKKYNLFPSSQYFQNYTPDATDIFGTATFVSTASDAATYKRPNLRPTSGSPVIDAGPLVTDTTYPPLDADGKTRVGQRADIGAFEFGGGSPANLITASDGGTLLEVNRSIKGTARASDSGQLTDTALRSSPSTSSLKATTDQAGLTAEQALLTDLSPPPTDAPPPPLALADTAPVPDSQDPYGVDLFMDPASGDLIVGANGGLVFTQGPESMVQALAHRIRTYPGELPLHADYGSQLAANLIGKKSMDPAIALATANRELANILQDDPRFLAARNIEAAQDAANPNAVSVRADLVLNGGEVLEVADLADARIDEINLTPQSDLEGVTAGEDLEDDFLAEFADLSEDDLGADDGILDGLTDF